MAGADKQAALVSAISDGVSAKMSPEFAKLSEEQAKLMVAVQACNARLSVLEQSLSNGGTGAKRPTRTGGGKAPASGKKPAAKGKGDAPDPSKVTNSLLYFRFAMQEDLEDYRATYGTEENLEEADKDQTVSKRDKIKEEKGYWAAVGTYLWKSFLSDEQKQEVKNSFTAWKEQSTRDDTEAALDEDGDGGDA
jgi:hypothetical protein